MPFENILVAIDGSSGSKIAQSLSLQISRALGARLTGQYVVNRADADLILSPEFAEEFGIQLPSDARKKADKALKRKALHELALFLKRSGELNLKDVKTCLDVGVVSSEILKRSRQHDLLVAGSTGRDQQECSETKIGTTVQRLALDSEKSVLVANHGLEELTQIVVGYDGSATSNGALVMAERLAVAMRVELKVIHVAPNKQHFPKAKVLMQRAAHHISSTAAQYDLRTNGGAEFLDKIVFMIKEGPAADNLSEFAAMTNALLVVGARGSRRARTHELGKIATSVVRECKSSLLLYRST